MLFSSFFSGVLLQEARFLFSHGGGGPKRGVGLWRGIRGLCVPWFSLGLGAANAVGVFKVLSLGALQGGEVEREAGLDLDFAMPVLTFARDAHAVVQSLRGVSLAFQGYLQGADGTALALLSDQGLSDLLCEL